MLHRARRSNEGMKGAEAGDVGDKFGDVMTSRDGLYLPLFRIQAKLLLYPNIQSVSKVLESRSLALLQACNKINLIQIAMKGKSRSAPAMKVSILGSLPSLYLKTNPSSCFWFYPIPFVPHNLLNAPFLKFVPRRIVGRDTLLIILRNIVLYGQHHFFLVLVCITLWMVVIKPLSHH